MDSILRALAVYLILMLMFALLGKRSLAQITMFDFLILLVVSEAVSEALSGGDTSIVGATLGVATLLLVSRAADALSFRFPLVDRLLNDLPLVLVDDGRPLDDRMQRVRVDAPDILERARELHGLERLDQVRYAVLERDGEISIVPR
jgi:uncharacterized membrane protein YcaP (DUF421 family)